ncbi:MAG: hypothetical protein N3A01_09285 [Bacteroidales bacterium]|nr:hypothetical protein [Bacteroidales bacterium]
MTLKTGLIVLNRYLFTNVILFVIIVGCKRPNYKNIVEKYPNNKIKSIIIIDTTEQKNDTIKITEYYFNGNIKLTGGFKNNKRHGEWIYYYNNGKIWSKGNFINGKSNGLFYVYNEDGSLFMISCYKNGIPDGIWSFYKNNRKIKEVIYKNGEKLKEIDF